jgi:hypothetical protein
MICFLARRPVALAAAFLSEKFHMRLSLDTVTLLSRLMIAQVENIIFRHCFNLQARVRDTSKYTIRYSQALATGIESGAGDAVGPGT